MKHTPDECALSLSWSLSSLFQVTDAIRTYVQEKITRALGNVAQVIKEVDVTLSVRGGDTGTGGKKWVQVTVVPL
jgi:ribosome-associated translation inhibitor RaiA